MRGRRPTVALGDAKKFAERQGYVWVPNPEPTIPFDAFAYRGNDIFALRVETCRNAPGVYDLHRDFFQNSFEILRKSSVAPVPAPRSLGPVQLEPDFPPLPAPRGGFS